MEAKELFDICEQLAAEEPSARATRRLHELLVLAAAEGCRRVGGTFGNLFAQVEFLCKQHGMDSDTRREMHTMRRHSNAGKAVEGSEWAYDLRALALLISAVFAADVPGQLRRRLPATGRQREKGLRINRRHLRCIVESWSDATITAQTADGPVVIDYGNSSEGRDFAYLRRLLTEGMQLNLLDCHVEQHGEVVSVVPGMVIVEPDFLVDISSIAACFTNYGHHPLLYTVNRLKPKANTQAILLGNFAGTALDGSLECRVDTHDSVECRVDSVEFATAHDSVECRVDSVEFPTAHDSVECRVDSVEFPTGLPVPHDGRAVANSKLYTLNSTLKSALRRSFREQALRFCACNEFDPLKFKAEATTQVKNIEEAVDVLFGQSGEPRNSPLFDKSLALLEPSFICERLGLQGRVDLMTSDLRLLVEQKSGKNPKIDHQSHDAHGQQLESHYVQLLLYYGLLRYNFGRSDQQVDIRLLYSRYPASQGLMSVAYYQQLLREALKLRNQIVSTELFIAREGFGRVLPLLNASVIYKDVRKDRIFHDYVEPELAAFAAPLAKLSPLERAYYERMTTFVYREQVYQKLGGSEARLHHSGGAGIDLWLMPVDEKQETGTIFMGLTVKELQRSAPDGGFDRIVLALSGGVSGQENFRRGDMVWLYSYREQPDVRQSILYKGTLDDIATETIAVRLSNGQQSSDAFTVSGVLWAVEHASADTSSSSSLRSLYQFAMASPRRKALLLGQRAPEADTSVQLSRSYHPNYDDIVLRVGQARDYFLLVGPPGTGKTSMALRYILEFSGERREERGERNDFSGERREERGERNDSSVECRVDTHDSVECRVLSVEFATALPSSGTGNPVGNSTLYTLHSTLNNGNPVGNSTLYTLHSTLNNGRAVANSTLYTLHSTLNNGRAVANSTLYTLHSTLNNGTPVGNYPLSTINYKLNNILLLSYTNRAVDEICAMLTDAGFSYLRIGNESACDPRFRDHLLEAALQPDDKLDDIRQRIQQTPIIVGTTSTMQSRQEIFQLKHFSLCIVDEASQILEPSIIGLLSSDQIDRFVLIGDHKQLPAVVAQPEEQARVSDPQLQQLCIDDCRQSLFERLLRWEQRCHRTQFIGTLHHQGRMHPDVASFPATTFYAEERLSVVPLPHQQATTLGYDLPAQDPTDQLLKEQRVVFFDVEGGNEAHEAHRPHEAHEPSSSFSDKVNVAEARVVADLLRRIRRFYGDRFSAEKTVGVIVPYRNQIAAIRQEIARLGLPDLLGISIDTVERYQGSQRDVIIYSFTITHAYQLDFLTANTFVDGGGRAIDRKLNVALTRARCQLLMTGCARVLSSNPLFRQLIGRYRVDA